MEPFPEYASFLIRVWHEPLSESNAKPAWRVEIVHLQNRERRTLDSLAALTTFLREQSRDPSLLEAKKGLR